MSIQLDFFQTFSEVEILEQKVKALENSLNKQRKAQFAQIGLLGKRYIEIHERLELLESAICKGKYPGW